MLFGTPRRVQRKNSGFFIVIMGIFISVQKTVECAVGAVCFALLFGGCCYRVLGILQSVGYDGKKFFGWAKKKGNLTFGKHVLLMLACALSCAVIGLCFSFAGEYAAVCALAAYLIFFPLFIWADNKIALRIPLAFTPRVKRLYGILCFTVAVAAYLAFTFLNFADFVWGNRIFGILRYVPLSLFPLLIIPFVLFANLISKIYETPKNKGYIKKARAKISSSQIRVIGVTGSYGKTSTKKVLCDILSKKYRVLATPSSHNTPLGLALSINSNELSEYDFFIAEMGARHVGDIAELCEICPPEVAVITGICPQHLESFGSEENVVKAKGEILQSCKSAVISGDCYALFEAYPCPKSRAECVSDLECGCDGSSFTLTLGGESVKTHTKLLGAHAVDNIALAATVAHSLGMSCAEIAAAVEGLEFVEHRLQLIKSDGVNILDDGYNSNIKGAAAALDVLRAFDGRKIVVTPGLVELGMLEESENYKLGARLAGLDFVILVGETLIAPVKKGYLENGGDESKLKVVLGLGAAQEELKKVLQKGDTVLFLNDVPDCY